MSEESKAFSLADISVNDLLDGTQYDGGDAADATTGSDNDQGTDPAENQNNADQNDGGEEGNDGSNSNDDQDSNDDGQSDNDQDDDHSDGEGDDTDGEEGEDDAPEPSVISEISELLGFEVEGEFPDDVQGIANFTKQVGTKMGEQFASQIFEQYPDVQQYLQFRAQGGDANKYFGAVKEEQDYASITEDQLGANPSLQEKMVRDFYTEMGLEESDINDTIKDLRESELLGKQAKLSHKKMTQMSAEKRQAMIQQQQVQAQQEADRAKQEWVEIADTIKKGSLKGLVVPESQKQNFYEWMSKPDEQGMTQRQRVMETMDTESSLALEYLIYQGFDFSKLTKSGAGSSKSKVLRDRIRSGAGSVNKTLNKGRETGHQRSTKLPGLGEIF